MACFLIYALLLLLTLLWIACDRETACVFDVFGKSFYYVWYESGERWRILLTYGWRLAALCSLILLNGILACRVLVENPLQLGSEVHVIVFAAMIAGSVAVFPWIYVAERFRWRRKLRSTARQLSDFAERLVTDSDFAETLRRADYDTKAPWTAWHPNQEQWEAKQFFQGVVPVAYVRNDSIQSVLFPVDWQTFLAWHLPPNVIAPGRDLPFHGALESSFRVKSVTRLRGCPDWNVIATEMQSELMAVQHTGSDL